MTFSEKFKELRKEKGISQAALARSLGVSQSSVNYWEKGERIPSIEAAKKIASFFEITPDELMDWRNNNPPISEEIKRVRAKKELSLEKLSKLSDIPMNKLKQFEAGSRLPVKSEFASLACVLDQDGSENFEKFFYGLYRPSGYFPEKNEISQQLCNELSHPESKLISNYRKLNEQGKIEANKRIEELTEIPKYTKRLIAYAKQLNAAHERTDIEITEEMKKHDDAIMNDEEF